MVADLLLHAATGLALYYGMDYACYARLSNLLSMARQKRGDEDIELHYQPWLWWRVLPAVIATSCYLGGNFMSPPVSSVAWWIAIMVAIVGWSGTGMAIAEHIRSE